MTFKSDWLIGSIESLPAYAYQVDAVAYGIAAGNYYLYDATGTRSMLQQLEDDMETENPGQNSAVFLTEAGYVRITADSAFSITWTDSEFRDWLGFTADVVSQTAVTASLKSPLFWSPSYRGTPGKSPGGIQGTKIRDTVITSSPSGSTVQATSHHTRTINSWMWDMVPIARVWTTDTTGLGGEFRRFYDEVMAKGYRWKHYLDIDEGTGTTAATLGTPLGPYKLPSLVDDFYNRAVAGADTRSRISFEAIKTDEMT